MYYSLLIVKKDRQRARIAGFGKKTAFLAVLPIVISLTLVSPFLLDSTVRADGWAPHDSGTSVALYGLWGDSPSSVFACGDSGTVLHFDGNQWSSLSTGVGQVLYGIWGHSPSNVFIAGNAGTILHYDGNTWTRMTSDTQNHLNAVWGTAPDDVFAAGSKGTILRYDGASWSSMTTGVTNTLYGVWGSSLSDVFSVGNGGTILRFDGSSWTQMSSNTTSTLWGVWGTSSSDVFAVGNSGCVLHYDGHSWTQMGSGVAENLYCVWGASSNDVFSAGANGLILHYDGDTWNQMTTATGHDLRSIWGSSGTDVFVAGESGTILHYVEFVPVVTSVIPDQGTQGDNLTVTISGDNFVDTLAVSFGEGILVDFSIDGATQITANITISAGAVAGPRDVAVTNPYGTDILTGGFTVQPINSPPVALDDSHTTDEDGALMVEAPGILGNDTDADGDPVVAVLVEEPSNGVLSLEPDGSFTYTPHLNFYGADSFSYQAFDGNAHSGNATVSITVNPVNDAPVAAADSFNVDEDGTLAEPGPGVLDNDADVEGDTLSVALVSDVSHGTLTLGSDGSFTYAPSPDFHGIDSFTYHAFDGTDYSSPATVSLNVLPVNDAPVAVNDSYSVDEDATLTIAAPGVLANDSDIDGDPLAAILISGPAHGTLSPNGDGSFVYSPEADYHGSDSFAYRAYDGALHSETAIVSIEVSAANDAPVARGRSYVTTTSNTLEIPSPGVLENDSDIDGDSLTAVLESGVSHGSLVLNPNGSFTYTPENGFTGIDSFSYRAFDGSLYSDPATVTLTVNWSNAAPVAADDAYTTDEDIVLLVSKPGVLGNDVDPDENVLTAVLVSGPLHGSLVLNSDGSFTYSPKADFFGTDFFTYQASDSIAGSEPAIVTILVNPVNDAPRAAHETFAVTEDETLYVDTPGVLANDSDVDGDALKAVLASPTGRGTLVLNSDGSFEYSPGPNFVGLDSFTYLAYDGSLYSDVVNVTIQVSQASPLALAISPSEGIAGQTVHITISGANFSGATAISLGPGIDIAGFQTESDDLLTAEVAINAGAAAGPRDLTITTSAGLAALPDAFQVCLPQPVISATDPPSAPRGRTLDLSVFGNHLSGTTSVSFGQGVAVNSFQEKSPQELIVSISIGSEALPGPRQITLSTPGGTATLSDGFQVTIPPPIVSGLSIDSVHRGQTHEIVISGENLDEVSEIDLGEGVTVKTFYLDGSSRILATVDVADDASAGPRDVLVETPGGTATLPGAFTIDWSLDRSPIWLWLGIAVIVLMMIAFFLLVTRRRPAKKRTLLDLAGYRDHTNHFRA